MSQKKTSEKIDVTGSRSSVSVCDIMNTNANSILEKLESLVPANMEMYSDFYTEYLHSLQDLFGACYIAENEILSKMGINQKALQAFEVFVKTVSKSAMLQIEMANNIERTHFQTQTSAVRILDEYIRLMLDCYSRMLASSVNFIKNY